MQLPKKHRMPVGQLLLRERLAILGGGNDKRKSITESVQQPGKSVLGTIRNPLTMKNMRQKQRYQQKFGGASGPMESSTSNGARNLQRNRTHQKEADAVSASMKT